MPVLLLEAHTVRTRCTRLPPSERMMRTTSRQLTNSECLELVDGEMINLFPREQIAEDLPLGLSVGWAGPYRAVTTR